MKKTLITAVLALAATGTVLSGSAPAEASTGTCHVHQVGYHWTCVTPGSYCPWKAHHHYGYARVTGHKYWCLRYPNGQ